VKDFAGKVAGVTGAASGNGRATATRFAQEGMQVVLADIEEVALEQAVRTRADAGHEVIGVPTDVSKWEAVQSLAQKTMEEFGGVNIVHNNAGVVVSGPIAKLSIADWEWVLGVDLWSVIYGVKAFLPLIKQTGEGHVVNTPSINGLQSAPATAPYNVAKFGVVALTETLRRELEAGKVNVSASILCPGAVNTQIDTSKRNRAAESANDHQSSAAEQAFEDRPAELFAQVGKAPAEVADMVFNAIIANQF
jgi:NAD(P)-dependent dehydrogenase (short-subunit alcohol dehydrogenase family)